MTDMLIPCGCWGPFSDPTDQIPDFRVKDYSVDSNKLIKAIENRDWDATTAILKKNPNEASEWVSYEGFVGIGSFWRLPLHEACMRQPSEAVVAALINANPGGVREKDSDGQLPLHHACGNGASHAVIYQLLIACPDSLDVRNRWGNFPIDVALSDPASTPEDVIKALKKRPSYYAVQGYKENMNELAVTLTRARTENEKLMKQNREYRSKEAELIRQNSVYKRKQQQLLDILQTNMD